MFYSQLVLTKKGLLGKVWLAATLGESKVPKSFATDAKIESLCASVEQPAAPFALRLSAHLMLGIARVFSRKSSIVLADVNAVMHALHRYHMSDVRAQGVASVVSGGTAGISLRTGDTARFDRITLPARKKRRKSAGSDAGLGPALCEDQFTSIGSLGELDLAEGGTEMDIVNAMEMVFPSVMVPRLGGEPNMGMYKNSASRSGSRRPPKYRARDQDITLQGSSGLLDSAAGDLFGSGMDLSLGFSGSNSVADVLQLGNSPMPTAKQDFDEHKDFQAVFGSEGSTAPERTSIASVRTQVVPNPENNIELLPGLDGQGMLQFEDLGFSPVQPFTIGHMPAAPTTDAATRNVSAVGSTALESRVKSCRRKELTTVVMDEVTELSAEHIRACLEDASDTLMPSGANRKCRKRRASGDDCALEYAYTMAPIFVSFAPEVVQMWNEVVRDPELAKFKCGNTEAFQQQPIIANLPTKYGIPELPVPERPMPGDDTYIASPATPPYAQAETRNISSRATNMRTPEGMRANSAVPFPDLDGFSGHSLSLEAGRLSSIGLTGSRASREPEFLRDQAFENVTAADVAAFEQARRLSIGLDGTEGTDGRESGSDFRARFSQGRGSASASRRFSAFDDVMVDGIKEFEQRMSNEDTEGGTLAVQESDFQLLEETERQDARVTTPGGRFTPVSQLGIRTFMVLEMLRRTETSATTGVQDPTMLTKFDTLVENCSRGARARAFYQVLALTTLDFVRVAQESPYGEIEMRAGTFF